MTPMSENTTRARALTRVPGSSANDDDGDDAARARATPRGTSARARANAPTSPSERVVRASEMKHTTRTRDETVTVALRDVSNEGEMKNAHVEEESARVGAGKNAMGDLKSMRARLDAARKESARGDGGVSGQECLSGNGDVANAAHVQGEWRAPEASAAAANKMSVGGVFGLYRDYYENEDFIEKCEQAINFRPKARPHDYKNRIDELAAAVKSAKDCLRHVFQNGASFSKELERFEANERVAYESLAAQVDALKSSANAAETESKSLRAQVQSLKNSGSAKEAELVAERERAEAELKEDVSAKKREVATLEKELTKKSKELDAAASKYAKLEASYTEASTRESVAKEANGRLERELKQLKADAEQFELTFAAERRALEGQLRKNSSELEAERARAMASRAQLEDSLREANSECESLRVQVQLVESAAARNAEQIGSSAAEIKEKLDSTDAELNELRKKASADEIAANDVIAQLKAEVKENKKLLTKQETMLTKKTARLEKLEVDIATMAAESSHVSSQARDFEAKLAEQQAMYAELKADFAATNAELKARNEDLLSLKDEFKSASDSASQLKASLESERATKETELKRAEKDVQRAESDLAEAKAQSKSLIEQQTLMMGELKQVREELASMEADRRNTLANGSATLQELQKQARLDLQNAEDRHREAVAEERSRAEKATAAAQEKAEEKMKAERDKADERVAAANEKLVAAQEEAASIAKELKKLQKEFDAKSTESSSAIAKLEKDLEEANAQIESLKTEIDEEIQGAAEELAAYKKSAEDKAARLADKHKRAHDELQAQLTEQMSGAQSNAAERIKEYSERLAAEEAKLKDAEAKLAKVESAKEKEASKAEEKLTKSSEKIESLEANLKTINEQHKSVVGERDALVNEKVALETRLFALEKSTEANAADSEAIAAKHAKKLAKIEARVKAVEDERDVLVSEKNALDAKINELTHANAALAQEKESIAKRMTDIETAKAAMEAEHESSMADIYATQERLKASEEAMQGHEARIQGVVAQLESEQKEVERLEKELKDNAAVSKVALDSLMASQKTLERERAELRSELNALREAEAMRKDQQGNEQIKALEARLVSQTREVDGARRIAKEAEEIRVQLEKSQARIHELEQQALDADAMRRALHNQIQELRGNVRVFCRVRPTENEPAVMCNPDGSSLSLQRVEGKGSAAFEFDRVFDPSAKQEEIFEEVSQLVQSALDGYKVCLFSYGQTGSGKTHTMLGDGSGDARGIIPRAVAKIVQASQQNVQKGWKYTMHASYVEIYNEQVRDLLRPGSDHSDKHTIVHKNGVTEVSNVQRELVDSVESAAALVRRASAARVVEATQMNAVSSRSHTIFMLYITGEHASSGSSLTGCLNLVDLAGSERVGRSGAEGARLKEACAINKSLSSLGDVFAALAAKQAHVPYRNSKLTYLLQPCLGGDGKTLMFVNINPETASTEETMCSLKFASQVNAVQLGDGKGAQRRITTKLSEKLEEEPEKTERKSTKDDKESKEKDVGERKRKIESAVGPRKSAK